MVETQDWEGLGLICTCSSQTSRLPEKQAAEVKDPGANSLRGDLYSTCLTNWLQQDLCYTPGLRWTPLKINPWWQKQDLWHTAQSLPRGAGPQPCTPAAPPPSGLHLSPKAGKTINPHLQVPATSSVTSVTEKRLFPGLSLPWRG